MSLEAQYDDLMQFLLIKKHSSPALFLNKLREIKGAQATFKTFKGDAGSEEAETSYDEFTFEGGANISTTVQEVAGVKKVTIDSAAVLTDITSITSPALMDLILDAGSGEIDIGNDIIKSDDADLDFLFGRCAIGSPVADYAYFAHRDCLTSSNFAVRQYADGGVFINSKTATYLYFGINNQEKMALQADGKFILSAGTDINEFSTDGTLAGNSDDAVPTEQAVKTALDARTSGDIYICNTEAEIVAAITAIGAGGGVIQLTVGTINLTAIITINIGGSVIIQGIEDKTIINCNADRTVFQIIGCDSCVLRDFKIDATDLVAGTPSINVTEGSDNPILIENLTIIGNDAGIGIEINSDNCSIKDCYFDNLVHGLDLKASYGNAYGNIAINNTFGIMIQGEYNSVIENKCYSNKEGIYSAAGSHNNIINSNNCSKNTENGIRLITSDDNNISNNICNNNNANSADAQAGIHLTTNCNQNTISGNTCNNNNNIGIGTSYGIYIENANDDENTVMGNTALGNDTNFTDNGTNTFKQTAAADPYNNI